MSKQVTLENTLAGGFGLPTGQLVPGNASMVVEPEIWAASKDHPVVKARIDAGTLIVDGKGKSAHSTGERDENGDTPEMAQMRSSFNDAYKKQGDALAASQSEVAAMAARVSELEGQVANLNAQLTSAPKADAPATAFEVKETSPGWFAAFDAEGKQVGAKMREADANAFKAMTPDEQKALLAE